MAKNKLKKLKNNMTIGVRLKQKLDQVIPLFVGQLFCTSTYSPCHAASVNDDNLSNRLLRNAAITELISVSFEKISFSFGSVMKTEMNCSQVMPQPFPFGSSPFPATPPSSNNFVPVSKKKKKSK